MQKLYQLNFTHKATEAQRGEGPACEVFKFVAATAPTRYSQDQLTDAARPQTAFVVSQYGCATSLTCKTSSSVIGEALSAGECTLGDSLSRISCACCTVAATVC